MCKTRWYPNGSKKWQMAHHFEHIPLKAVFPEVCSRGRWYGKPDCYFCRCQEWNLSICFMRLHQMCWTQSWQTCELLYATGEQIEVATKTLEYKRLLLISPVRVIVELCAERMEIRNGWNSQLLKSECVCWCHKTGHLVLSIILSLPAVSSPNILIYLSVVPPHQKSWRTDWQVCGWLQGSRSPQAQRGRRRSCPAQLCRPLCVLQEVHGAVLPAQHRRADDSPDHHIPEVPSGIRLENSVWKPAQVSFTS